MLKKRTKTNFIVVHCSDTFKRMDIGAREIDRWHRERDWLMIGYHYVIRRDGTVEAGREDDKIGSHVSGFNNNSVGICLVGGRGDDNKPENNFTEEQFISLKGMLKDLSEKYPEADILGHTDLNEHKACPCFDVKQWVQDNLS